MFLGINNSKIGKKVGPLAFGPQNRPRKIPETKLYVLDGVMNICSWDLGHMIKMAAIPIYGKMFSGTEWLMILKFGMPIGYQGFTRFFQIVILV